MTATKTKLHRGQVPFSDLITVKTAHDVRRLCACQHCGEIGDNAEMVFAWPYETAYFHGRCFAKAHGVDALIDLKPAGLTLGDLGLDLMRAVLAAGEAS